jgi:hypothetical protein
MTVGSAAPGTLGMAVGSRWWGKNKKGQHFCSVLTPQPYGTEKALRFFVMDPV